MILDDLKRINKDVLYVNA
ncbi:short chain dehydrogenase family protein, partial [Yersinia pestis PY-93]